MSLPEKVKFKRHGEGKVSELVGDVYTLIVSGEQTGGAYATVHAVIGPHSGPPPHVHSREDEAFYVLEGHVDFMVGGETIHAGPGDYVHLPKNLPHTFKNPSAKPARALISVFPAGFEAFLFEAGAPSSEDIGVVFKRLFPKYGISFA